jgi:hypothetical protein
MKALTHTVSHSHEGHGVSVSSEDAISMPGPQVNELANVADVSQSWNHRIVDSKLISGNANASKTHGDLFPDSNHYSEDNEDDAAFKSSHVIEEHSPVRKPQKSKI